MVGRPQWPPTEIMWILKNRRDNYEVNDLVESYRRTFPKSKRNGNIDTLRAGIKYVWDNYKKNPSYNHSFSEDEIWFIMVQSYMHKGTVSEKTLHRFKQAFPDHDWKPYVIALLAMEAAMAKYQQTSPYCVQWRQDEIQFVLQKKLDTESWEELLTAFQAWQPREEITSTALRYLYESRQLDKYRNIDEFNDYIPSITNHISSKPPTIVQNPKKRRHGGMESIGEIHTKRTRMSDQQRLELNVDSQQFPMYINGIDAGIPRYCEVASSRHLRTYPLLNSDNFESWMPPLEGDPPRKLPDQAAGTLHLSINNSPEHFMYEGWDQPYSLTPKKITTEEYIRLSHGQSEALHKSAVISPTTGPERPSADSWYQSDFRPVNHHMGSISTIERLNTHSIWDEPKFVRTNNSWATHHNRGSQSSSRHLENPAMQFTVTYMGSTQQTGSTFGEFPFAGVTGGNSTLFQGLYVLPPQTDCLLHEGLEEPIPTVPSNLSDIFGMGAHQSTSFSNMAASQREIGISPNNSLEGEEHQLEKTANVMDTYLMEGDQSVQDTAAFYSDGTSYMDELWEMAVVTESSGFDGFLHSDNFDFVTSCDLTEQESENSTKPSEVVTIGEHLSQVSRPTTETLHGLQTFGGSNPSTCSGTSQGQVLSDEENKHPDHATVQSWAKEEPLIPEAEDIEDAQARSHWERLAIFGPGYRDILNPELEP